MTITPEQKSAIVAASGFDPNIYTTDDTGDNIIQKPTGLSPTNSPDILTPKVTATPQQQPNNTPLETAGKSFLQAVPDMLGGGFGAGGGAALGFGMGGPLGSLAGGVAGALAGSSAAKYIRQKIEPDSWQQNVEQAQQENPKSAMLGNIAAMPFGGFMPSPSNVGNAAGGLIKTLSPGIRATAPEMQNMVNVGIGAGLGGVQPIAESLVRGQPMPSAQDTVMNTLIGALFNKPNRLGNAMGFHNAPTDSGEATADMYQRVQQQPNIEPPVQTMPQESLAELRMRGLVPDKNGNLVPIKDAQQNYTGESYVGDATTHRIPRAADEEVNRFENEGGQVKDSTQQATDTMDQIDALKQKQLETQKRIEEFKLAQKEVERQQEEAKAKAQYEATQKKGMLGGQLTAPEKTVPPVITTELGKDIMPDYTGNVEHDNLTIEKESADDLAARKLEGFTGDKYQPESALPPSSDENPTKETINKRMRLVKNDKGDYNIILTTGIQDKIIGSVSKGWSRLGGNGWHVSFDNSKGAVNRNVTSTHPNLERAKAAAIDRVFDVETKNPDIQHQSTGDIKTASQQTNKSLLEQYTPKKSLFEFLQKTFANRGLKLQQDNSIVDSSGKPISGVALMKEGVAKINSSKAGGDTIFHEGNHLFTRRLEESTLPRDRQLIARRNKVIESSDDFKRWQSEQTKAGYKQPTVDEYAATDAGEYAMKRALNGDNETPLKQWIGDYKSYLKTRFGTHATSEDFNRMMTYKFYHDKPETNIKPSVNAMTGEIKEQPDSGLPSEQTNTPEFKRWFGDSVLKDEKGQPIIVHHGTRTKDPMHVIDPTTKNVGTFDPNNPDIRYQSNSHLPKFLTPELEVVEKNRGPEGEAFSAAYSEAAKQKERMVGEYMHGILEAAHKMPRNDINIVERIRKDENAQGMDLSHQLQNAKQRNLYDAIKASLLKKQQDQIAANQPVTDWNAQGKAIKRLPQINDNYHPNRLDPNIADVLHDPDQQQKADQYKQDFINHQLVNGGNLASATDKWQGIVDSYKHGEMNLNKFGAVRKTEGVGLPDSMMRKGRMIQDLYNYFGHVAADRSFHDQFEAKPDIAHSIGMKNDPWDKPITSTAKNISDDPHVSAILDRMRGEAFDKDEQNIKAYNRIATAAMLGPLTNIHIALSSIASTLNHLRPTEAPRAHMYALSNLVNGYDKALGVGGVKKNLTSFRDMFDSTNTAIEKLSAVANNIGKLSGRDATNNFTKAYLQNIGEWLVKQRALQANGGDAKAIQFMKNLDSGYTTGKQYVGNDLSSLASQWAGLIHGTHDPRTLPGWMLKDTAVQPFFSLMSWNISQTSQWMKNVFNPAKEGNYTPLLMSTLGAGLGGYIIKEAREKLSDKKAAYPSLDELIASDRGLAGNPGLVAQNLMAMASYTGYMGIMSTAAKAVGDLAHKDIPQSATFPLDEVISNGSAEIAKYISALTTEKDFDFMPATAKLMTNLARENVQIGRIALNWASEYGLTGEDNQVAKATNDKLGDLRRFKMAEGLPYEAQTVTTGNPYVDMGEKHFKKTSDLNEAVSLLPDLVHSAMEKADGNIDVLRAELQKIKGNAYETMPNPERIPRTFLAYLNYLKQTQGDKVASERLTDYLVKSEINKVKSSLVPSI